MRLTEGHIHVAMRRFLKRNGWELIAGQYPGGSDDELCALNVVDPILARDLSPDPRRHSFGKLVPDLVARNDNFLLVIEAKVGYSYEDKLKLENLLGERREDFISALTKFAMERSLTTLIPIAQFTMIPALAFSSKTKASLTPGFLHLRVTNLDSVCWEGTAPAGLCLELTK